MRTDILEKREQILAWIEEEQPKCYICQQLNCKQDTLNRYLKQMGIEYDGQQNKKGQQKGSNKYKDVMHYIQSGKAIASSKLKEKLLIDGLKERKCEKCGLDSWLNGPIPLELHHKDGNHYNNAFENLQILCPNCHALESVETSNHKPNIN